MRPLTYFTLIFLTALSAHGAPAPVALKKMSLRTKIGQMFMIGFQGTRMSEGLEESIRDVKPGALLIFSRNISSPYKLSSLIRQAQFASVGNSGVPLLIAADQEGGDVIRVKSQVPLPSALALGRAENELLAEKAGRTSGQLLKAIGINMNLAPVLDVADPRQPSFIGTRTFGSRPDLVSKIGIPVAIGLSATGVLPTAKHFPGHGGIAIDSHTTTAEKNVSREDLFENDLKPFTELKQKLGSSVAIMVGHVSYPKIDPSGSPASLSKPIVTGLLREHLGFEGLVITDDIGMAGAGAAKSVKERVLQSIEAGVDMVIVTWNKKLQRDLVDAVERAVKRGRIPESRINQSVRRILAAKTTYAKDFKKDRTEKDIRLAVENREFAEIGAATVAARFGHGLDKEEIELQEYSEGKELLAFSTNTHFLANFKSALRSRKVRTFALDLNRPHDIEKVMRSNPKAFGVFYVSGYQVAEFAAHISAEIARRTLLVTVAAQGSIPNASSFRYVTEVYHRDPSLGRMIANHYFKSTIEIRAPASVWRDDLGPAH